MRFRRPPPRAYKPVGSRPVTADVDPALLSERAAMVARGLLGARTPLELISRAAAELDAIARHSATWPEAKARLQAWGDRPELKRWPRLARLLSACANAARRPEDLRAQVAFLRRIMMLATFSAALGVGTALERERTARLARAKSVRNKQG